MLRPGGTFVLVDKNVLLDERPAALAASLAVKWLDERRGLWMYPPGGPVRERWFRPGELKRRLSRWFADVRVDSPALACRGGPVPVLDVPCDAAVRALGGQVAGRGRVIATVFADPRVPCRCCSGGRRRAWS